LTLSSAKSFKSVQILKKIRFFEHSTGILSMTGAAHAYGLSIRRGHYNISISIDAKIVPLVSKFLTKSGFFICSVGSEVQGSEVLAPGCLLPVFSQQLAIKNP
jgi:hypothetical protein